MASVEAIASAADIIVGGYAFARNGEIIRVINLHNMDSAAVIRDDKIIETTMDDIEMAIVQGIYERDKEFLEA